MARYIRRPQASVDNVTVSGNSLLDRIYKSRGVEAPGDLIYNLKDLIPPSEMKDMDKGARLLADAIMNDKSIMVISDYDCDGATSCAIAVEGLTQLGAKNVSFIVPNRFEYGYGLSPAIVALAAKQRPDLIVTVDNGIASFEGAQAVADLPWDCKLLITDHHLAPSQGVPVADAIINPNQPDCNFPSKSIAGCGVMFYTLLGTRAYLRDQTEWFSDSGVECPSFMNLLDVLALGTVADVVALDKNNRIIVDSGLKVINSSSCRPGIRSLLEVGKRCIGKIVSADLGFCVGPRLNAAGRLDDMTVGIKCLLEQDELLAMEYAQMLDRLNGQRKEIEVEMKVAALAELDPENEARYGLCVFDENFHEGVVGIVASRIKDKYHRPTIVFACEKGSDDSIKGSARSIKGLHLRDVLDAVATRNPGLLTKFGGHAMAAGLSLKLSDYEKFAEEFDLEVRKHLGPDDIAGTIETDGELSVEEMTQSNAEQIMYGGPWGQEFPEPLFDGVFQVIESKIVGSYHLKLRLRHSESGQEFDGIAFNVVDDGRLPAMEYVHISYKLNLNEFRGVVSLQLMIDNIEALEREAEAA